jgi:hypothetical protein
MGKISLILVTTLCLFGLFIGLSSSSLLTNSIHVKAQEQQPIQSGIPWLPPAEQPQQTQQQSAAIPTRQGPSESFGANGTINSVLFVPNNVWIATGNWSMVVNNGNVTSFVVDMVWNNNNGTSSHTHQVENFRPINGGGIVTLQPDNSVLLNGFTDVGTNGRIVWKNVHTIIDFNKGKTINIAVNDKETSFHFAGQHVYGIVNSLSG